jgi:hypothetical protein
VRPGGKVLIADLALPQGGALSRCAQRAYSRAANVIFWALGLVPLHPIYDYRRHFADSGLEFANARSFRILGFGPVAYESLTAIAASRDNQAG